MGVYLSGAAASDPELRERLDTSFATALDCPPVDRLAYLRSHRVSPGMLHAVPNMLDIVQFETGVTAPDSSGDERAPDALADLQIGGRIGPYEILDHLGRGGMGQVFLCFDRELGRRVALKCLLQSPSGHPALERARIRQEAQAAAAINHPHVAAVYHIVDHGRRLFIVIEYVAGESLASRLRRERLTPKQTVTIGRQLAADFGDPDVDSARDNIWNFSIAIGFDLRRVGD